MLANKIVSVGVVLGVAIIAASGGYYYSARADVPGDNVPGDNIQVVTGKTHAKPAERTSTIVLPGQTRSAWKIHDYKLKDINGVTHQLNDWKGKTILINFWASWCQPCQYEIPDLIALQKKYAAQGLQVVSYGLDEKAKLKNVVRSLGINYPVLIVPQGLRSKLLKQWGNKSAIIPHSVMIDKTGTIKYIHRGMISDDAIELYLLPLLKS